MLLLYPLHRILNKRPWLSFTFHYASTISVSYCGFDCSCYHLYIPLCFYYIYGITRICDIPISFTFHYASTISHYRTPRHYRTPLYIPLCFYYILSDPQAGRCGKPLYIPLCFYYIHHSKGSQGSKKSTLHSTMLLLYRIFPTSLKPWMILYIPLCFYYIRYHLCLVISSR